MRRPTLGLAAAFNRAVRREDEWWDEPEDLERVERALRELATSTIQSGPSPFSPIASLDRKGSVKATSALPYCWRDGAESEWTGRTCFLAPDDWALADLLVKAASGLDVEENVVELLNERR